MRYNKKDKVPERIMGCECIHLDESPAFNLYVSRIGNNKIEAARNLEFAAKTGNVSIPEGTLAYIYPTSQGIYEAAFGPKQKENNSPTKILHGDELRRYIDRIPGRNIEEKLRNLTESARQGTISKRTAQGMIDALCKGNKKTSEERDESLDGSLL
jgi:hypothetical protein